MEVAEARLDLTELQLTCVDKKVEVVEMMCLARFVVVVQQQLAASEKRVQKPFEEWVSALALTLLTA